METHSRRRFLEAASITTAVGTAGCIADLFPEPHLNVWVRNDREEPIDYEISVENFEKTGSLEGDDLERFEDALRDPGSGQFVDVEIWFGIEDGDEFVTLAEESESMQVGSDTEAIFARINEMGVFYGPTDEE